MYKSTLVFDGDAVRYAVHLSCGKSVYLIDGKK